MVLRMQVKIAFYTSFLTLISAQSIRQTVLEGNNLFVFCDGERSPDGSVYWENSDLRFHQEGPILSISKVTREFSQYYECFDIDHSINSTRQIYAAYVDVMYPAQIFSHAYTDTVVENETFSAELSIDGNPLPEVLLAQKSNGAVAFRSEKRGEFNVTFEVKCSSMGMYLLTCSNLFNYDEISLNLTVLCSPRPDPGQTIIYRQAPRVGEFLKLEMIASGYPAPTFSWVHSGNPVDHKDNGFTSNVDIQGVKVEDFGNYTLTMINSVGEIAVMYFVDADGPPDSATNLQVGDVTLDTATLTWKPGFDYGNIQTFTVLNAEKEIDTITMQDHSLTQVTHTLHHLQQAETYNIQIKSSNSRGNAAALSNTVTFTTGRSTQPPQPTRPKPSGAPETHKSNLLIVLLALFITLT